MYIKQNGKILKKHIEKIEGYSHVLPSVYEDELNEEELQILKEEYGLDTN